MRKNKQRIKRCLCIIPTLLLLAGCSTKQPEIIFKEVLVPTKCDVKQRNRPQQQKNIGKYLTEILIYVEGLERDLTYCRGEVSGDNK